MKNIYKILIGATSVCVILKIADWSVGTLSEKLYHDSKYGIYRRQLYCLNESKDEMLILGSSRAAHHYVPQILEDSLGMSCYNAGSDGQCIYYHYTLLASMIERGARPKLVVYEVMGTDAEESEGTTFTLDAALERLTPHCGEFKAVDSLLALNGWKERLKLCSKTYRYNSKFVQMLKCKYCPTRDEKGYEALYGKMKLKPSEMQATSVALQKMPIEQQKLEYVYKLIGICMSYNIKLCFMYSPYYGKLLPYGAGKIKEIARDKRIPFCDFSEDKRYCDTSLFKDKMHFNDDGARLYTSDVVVKIRECIATE